MTMRFALLGVLVACVACIGCKQEQKEFQEYSQAEQNQAVDPHDDGGHDHGGHEHGPHGPHDGHVIEVGDDEYHAEVTFDKDARRISVYFYGHNLNEKQAIAQSELTLDIEDEDSGEETEIVLAAAPEEGETEGKASRFEVAGDKVPEGIDDIEKIHGHIHVTIAGKEYTVDINHDHDHDHEGHDHEGHDHDDHDHDHDKKKGHDDDDDGHDKKQE
ncbi:MAG: hypothetical protein ABGZ17_09360 [Planctomycetaceae bacterium]